MIAKLVLSLAMAASLPHASVRAQGFGLINGGYSPTALEIGATYQVGLFQPGFSIYGRQPSIYEMVYPPRYNNYIDGAGCARLAQAYQLMGWVMSMQFSIPCAQFGAR